MLPAASAEPVGRPVARLSGRRLWLARAAWLAVALLTVALFLIAVPERYAQLRTLCDAPRCAEVQLAPADAPALARLGLSLEGYAAYNIALENIFPWCCFLVGAIIFWRRSDDAVALFVALTLVTWGATLPPVIEALATARPAWRPATLAVQDLALACLVILFYLFPDGRFVPRWTRWVAAGWAGWALVRPAFLRTTPFLAGRPEALVAALLLGLGVAAQVHRYRRASGPVQRQQTKWAVSGLAAMALGIIAYVALHQLVAPVDRPGAARVLANLVAIPVFLVLPGLMVPLSLGVATLRYRLWDIDMALNRALVYGALTATLALVYTGSVVALQGLFRGLTGQRSNLAVVASTLAIAALAQPLRRRIQAFIDRRFYRHKYDAQQTLAAFSAALRDETDLVRIQADLLGVVRETLQPAHASLWLRPPEQKAGEQERGRSSDGL